MRVAPRPKAVAEPKKVDFVDGTQHLSDRTLDDLVFEHEYTEGPPPTIGFRDVGATYRLRPVAPGVNPFAEIPDIGIQVLLVVRNRHPIYSGTRLPPQPAERPLERCVVHVVQQGREADLARTSCHLIHPGEFGWQRCPALCPVSRRPSQIPRGSGSYLELARFLRRCHQTYTPIRHPVSAQPAASVVPCHRPPSATEPKDPTGLPKFRRVPFMHEMAFDPGRAAVPRISAPFVLPSSCRTDSASAM
jgi:hypothetical protein